jgi:Flp pilus assembly pilin Flp
MFASVYALVGAVLRAVVAPGLGSAFRREEGQTTAEYALVILAAAAIAVVLIAWARSSGKLPDFFNNIIDQVAGSAS